MLDETENADEKVQSRSSAAKLARQVAANDIKWLMSGKQGRRVAWRLLEKAGVYRTSFTGNNETFFLEGMRNMGLFLIAEIHAHAPDSYALMVAESQSKTKAAP